jgi:hypothetical protein
MLSKLAHNRSRKSTRNDKKQRLVVDDADDASGDEGSGGFDSDHIDCRTDAETDDEDLPMNSNEDELMEQLELIKSKSDNNIRNRQRAHAEAKGERQRQRDIRRKRMSGKDGGGEVASASDGKGFGSNDISPVDSSDEESDSDDDDESDCVVITKSMTQPYQQPPVRPTSVKRKASAEGVSSSGIDSDCYKLMASAYNERKREGRTRGGAMSSRVVSPGDASDGEIKDKSKKTTYLTGIRKVRRKKKRRKGMSRHTKHGRTEERVMKGTETAVIFIAKVAIANCTDEQCHCSKRTQKIIDARTFNLTKTSTERKQWLLDKISEYQENYTHFVVNRKLVCRSCFEAFYGIKVLSQFDKFFSVAIL